MLFTSKNASGGVAKKDKYYVKYIHICQQNKLIILCQQSSHMYIISSISCKDHLTKDINNINTKFNKQMHKKVYIHITC